MAKKKTTKKPVSKRVTKTTAPKTRKPRAKKATATAVAAAFPARWRVQPPRPLHRFPVAREGDKPRPDPARIIADGGGGRLGPHAAGRLGGRFGSGGVARRERRPPHLHAQ